MAERNVLLKSLKHPFLVGLHYSFQTSEKLYFVLDYVNGGEVRGEIAEISHWCPHKGRLDCCFLDLCNNFKNKHDCYSHYNQGILPVCLFFCFDSFFTTFRGRRALESHERAFTQLRWPVPLAIYTLSTSFTGQPCCWQVTPHQSSNVNRSLIVKT